MNKDERFEVLEPETLMEVQGGDSKESFFVTLKGAVLELLGLNQKNDK